MRTVVVAVDISMISWRFCQTVSAVYSTKLLLIGTRQMLQNNPAGLDLHVTLLGKELRPVVTARDLGVYMDAILSFDESN